MKLRFVLTALLAAGLFACNEIKKEDTSHVHSQDSITHPDSEKQSQLVLNDGKKWKIDEATRNNMDSIRKTVQNFVVNKEANEAKLVTDLQKDVNRLVSQCRMSGRDHDMLHLWLESFLSDLKQLKSSSEAELPITFARVENKVKEFDNYFEY